jgi:Ni/Co efflux regulator RcnB
MRLLSMILALGLSATFAMPADADFRFSARIGTGVGTVAVHTGNVFRGNGHKGNVSKRNVSKRNVSRGTEFRGNQSRGLEFSGNQSRGIEFRGDVFRGNVIGGNVVGVNVFGDKRRAHRRPGRHARHGLHSFPFFFRDSQRDDERFEPAPAPVQVAPVPPVAVEPPPPPDPRGPLRLTPARGIAPGAAPYSVGEALPQHLPHVTLDWRQFDLPEPPPGRLYARVGRDVLLITATGRVVESVVPLG